MQLLGALGRLFCQGAGHLAAGLGGQLLLQLALAFLLRGGLHGSGLHVFHDQPGVGAYLPQRQHGRGHAGRELLGQLAGVGHAGGHAHAQVFEGLAPGTGIIAEVHGAHFLVDVVHVQGAEQDGISAENPGFARQIADDDRAAADEVFLVALARVQIVHGLGVAVEGRLADGRAEGEGRFAAFPGFLAQALVGQFRQRNAQQGLAGPVHQLRVGLGGRDAVRQKIVHMAAQIRLYRGLA